MSTEERGGGGGGGGQGFASRQFGPLKPLPPRMSRAEDDQGGLDPPPSAPAAAGSGSQAAPGFGSQAEAACSPPAPENEQGGLDQTAAAGSGSQAEAACSPPAPENEQGGLDQTVAAAEAGGSSPAETSLVSSVAAEQEVQPRPTRNLASRCCNFRFDDRKLWVCAAGVLLVLPLLSGIIYLVFSH